MERRLGDLAVCDRGIALDRSSTSSRASSETCLATFSKRSSTCRRSASVTGVLRALISICTVLLLDRFRWTSNSIMLRDSCGVFNKKCAASLP